MTIYILFKHKVQGDHPSVIGLTQDVTIKNSWILDKLHTIQEFELGAIDDDILGALSKISMCCRYGYHGNCSVPSCICPHHNKDQSNERL